MDIIQVQCCVNVSIEKVCWSRANLYEYRLFPYRYEVFISLSGGWKEIEIVRGSVTEQSSNM